MTCTGDVIRREIKITLETMGFKGSPKNVEIIFSQHLGDSSDMSYRELINLYDWKLEK